LHRFVEEHLPSEVGARAGGRKVKRFWQRHVPRPRPVARRASASRSAVRLLAAMARAHPRSTTSCKRADGLDHRHARVVDVGVEEVVVVGAQAAQAVRRRIEDRLAAEPEGVVRARARPGGSGPIFVASTIRSRTSPGDPLPRQVSDSSPTAPGCQNA
jgi:hypothetical protein